MAMKTEISRKTNIPGIRPRLRAVLEWCKRTAGRCYAFASGKVWLTRRGSNEVARMSSACHPWQIDFGGERMELNKLFTMLSIGDRIRVFCDDGVVVAEKISQTQFQVVHSQSMTKWLQ